MRNSVLISERARRTSMRPWTTLRMMLPSIAAVSGGTRAGSTLTERRKPSQSKSAPPVLVPALLPATGLALRDDGAGGCGGRGGTGFGVGGCGGVGDGGVGRNFDRSNDVRSQFSGITLAGLAAP